MFRIAWNMDQAIEKLSASVISVETTMPNLTLREYPWAELVRFAGLQDQRSCPEQGAFELSAEGLLAITAITMMMELGFHAFVFWYLAKVWKTLEALGKCTVSVGEAFGLFNTRFEKLYTYFVGHNSDPNPALSPDAAKKTFTAEMTHELHAKLVELGKIYPKLPAVPE